MGNSQSSKGKEDIKYSTKVGVMERDDAVCTIISPHGKMVEIGKDVDDAMALANEAEGICVSEAEDRKLLFKIDVIVLPIFCFLYMIQFMDKTCIGFAVVMGIEEDYKMKGQMYSWTNSCFYLGYLIALPIAARVLQILPPMKSSAIFIIIWGIIQCLHATATIYPTFVLLRTLLGALEAFVSPVFVIVLSQYYKKTEHFGRTAVFYGFNGLGTVVLSAITYGLFNNEESYTMASYKVLFLIIGCSTITIGILIYIIMPSTPAGAKFLNDREKLLILERIRDNNQGFGSRKFKKYQIMECIVDFRTWVYFLLAVCVAIPNGGISGFGTLILTSLGYTSLNSLLMKAPVGGVELIGLILLPFISILVPKRMFVAMFYTLIVIVFSCLLAFASNEHVQLSGYYMIAISPVGIIAVTSCITSNTAGHTKKLFTNAFSLIGYSCGNIIGPQTFRDSDKPQYRNAKATIVGCYSASLVLMAFLTIMNIIENKKRDRNRENMEENYVVMKNIAFADLTDFENPEFRYAI